MTYTKLGLFGGPSQDYNFVGDGPVASGTLFASDAKINVAVKTASNFGVNNQELHVGYTAPTYLKLEQLSLNVGYYPYEWPLWASGDIASGNWQETPLWNNLNLNSGIYSELTPSNDTFEVALYDPPSGIDPVAQELILEYKYKKINSSKNQASDGDEIDLTISVYSSGVEIASFTNSGIEDQVAPFRYSIPAASRASITDPPGFSIRGVAQTVSASGGGNERAAFVEYVKLVAHAASGTNPGNPPTPPVYDPGGGGGSGLQTMVVQDSGRGFHLGSVLKLPSQAGDENIGWKSFIAPIKAQDPQILDDKLKVRYKNPRYYNGDAN